MGKGILNPGHVIYVYSYERCDEDTTVESGLGCVIIEWVARDVPSEGWVYFPVGFKRAVSASSDGLLVIEEQKGRIRVTYKKRQTETKNHCK